MAQDDYKRLLSRRDVCGGAGAAALILAGTGGAAAQGHDHDGHSAHAGHGAHAALIDAASACVKDGETCLAHCIQLMGAGDTSMKDCAEAVSAMIPVSQTLLRLAAMDAVRLKFYAVVASDFLKDCRTQCKRHAPEHPQCKACLEACDAALAEIRTLIV